MASQITLRKLNIQGYRPEDQFFTISNTALRAVPGSSGRVAQFIQGELKAERIESVLCGGPQIGVRGPEAAMSFMAYAGAAGFTATIEHT